MILVNATNPITMRTIPDFVYTFVHLFALFQFVSYGDLVISFIAAIRTLDLCTLYL